MNYGMDYLGDNGGGGGGGFSNYGGGGGMGDGQSQSSQRTRRTYDEQTLIPITIRMALESEPASHEDSGGNSHQCLPDGRKAATVVLVGAVRSVQDQSTNVVYEFEDGTGLMEVKQWLDDNDPTAITELRAQSLKENIYVKVVGQIKDYDGKKLLVANLVRPLTTGNQLSHHMLQVAYSAEAFKRADSIVAQPTTPHMVTSANTTLAELGGAGGGSIKQQVLEYFKREGAGLEEGASVQKCSNWLPAQTLGDIRKIVEELVDEGNLYSTIDDDHFKIAV